MSQFLLVRERGHIFFNQSLYIWPMNTASPSPFRSNKKIRGENNDIQIDRFGG